MTAINNNDVTGLNLVFVPYIYFSAKFIHLIQCKYMQTIENFRVEFFKINKKYQV